MSIRACTKCGKLQTLTAFTSGNRTWCRACVAIYHREYYLANREKCLAIAAEYRQNNRSRIAATQARWRDAHPDRRLAQKRKSDRLRSAVRHAARRAREFASPGRGITSTQRRQILADSLGLCAYCNTRSRVQLDHIEPLNRGGEHDIDNGASACGLCNSSKHDTPLLVWLAGRAVERALQVAA